MARGKQKVQAQEKNAAKQAKLKKQAAKGGGAAPAKNAMTCKICFAQVIGNALKRTKVRLRRRAESAAAPDGTR
jgi:hypothetical protein